MVKAPSSHGLDKKFKPWRRGKGKTTSTPKQQLRGQLRLLKRITDDVKRQEIQKSISDLEHKIQLGQQQNETRERAIKSHGKRFLEVSPPHIVPGNCINETHL
jgi:hypothetical protein